MIVLLALESVLLAWCLGEWFAAGHRRDWRAQREWGILCCFLIVMDWLLVGFFLLDIRW